MKKEINKIGSKNLIRYLIGKRANAPIMYNLAFVNLLKISQLKSTSFVRNNGELTTKDKNRIIGTKSELFGVSRLALKKASSLSLDEYVKADKKLVSLKEANEKLLLQVKTKRQRKIITNRINELFNLRVVLGQRGYEVASGLVDDENIVPIIEKGTIGEYNTKLINKLFKGDKAQKKIINIQNRYANAETRGVNKAYSCFAKEADLGNKIQQNKELIAKEQIVKTKVIASYESTKSLKEKKILFIKKMKTNYNLTCMHLKQACLYTQNNLVRFNNNAKYSRQILKFKLSQLKEQLVNAKDIADKNKQTVYSK